MAGIQPWYNSWQFGLVLSLVRVTVCGCTVLVCSQPPTVTQPPPLSRIANQYWPRAMAVLLSQEDNHSSGISLAVRDWLWQEQGQGSYSWVVIVVGFGEGRLSPSKVWESGSKAPRKVWKFDVQVFLDFDAFWQTELYRRVWEFFTSRCLRVFVGPYPKISHRFCANPIGCHGDNGGFHPPPL